MSNGMATCQLVANHGGNTGPLLADDIFHKSREEEIASEAHMGYADSWWPFSAADPAVPSPTRRRLAETVEDYKRT